MSLLTSIYKKELLLFFHSLTGWVLIAVILLLFGIFFSVNNLSLGYANFEYVVDSMLSMQILIIPVLTMRSYSEEWKMQTYRLLYSAPVLLSHIVIGKYLSALTTFLIPVLIASLYPIVLCIYGNCPLAAAYNAIIGFVFLGAALIAVGQFISASMKNAVLSAITCIALFLFALLLPQIISLLPASGVAAIGVQVVFILFVSLVLLWYSLSVKLFVSVFAVGILITVLSSCFFASQDVLSSIAMSFIYSLAFFSGMENFVAGIIDIPAAIYYCSIVVVFLTLTVQVVDRPRWIK